MRTRIQAPDGWKIAELAACGAVLVAAYVLTTEAGRRGFYAFDQSIVFDGSYRVVSGQIPYKDFLLPFGPVTFWLHALSFRIFGVNYDAYVMGAGVVNVAACLAAMLIVKDLFPRPRLLPIIAGTLTAVWFYPPFGTPWADQTAFFFGLLATGAAAKGLLHDSEIPRRSLLVLSGSLMVLCFLSKQNVGLFLVPLIPLLMVAGGSGRRGRILGDVGFFLVGALLTGTAFLIWLAAASDPGAFVYHFFEIPSKLGRQRLSAFLGTGFGILRPFFGGRGPAIMVVGLWFSLGVGVGTLAALLSGRSAPTRRRHLLSAVLCIYLPGFQHVFINTTLNQPENGLGLSGLAVALAAGLVLNRNALARRWTKVLFYAALVFFVLFASVTGYGVAMRRDVHETLRGAEFDASVPVEGLEGLEWARPTRIQGYEVRPEHLAFLCGYLEERGENFFVFPDFTLLYGILGVPSPQPLLWFHDGVTYSRGDNDRLDERIVASLRRNNVKIVIREKAAWFDVGKRLDDFPRLEAFIKDEFEKKGEVGIFSVYERP